MDKKEARDILIGRLIRLDEKNWAAAPADVKFHFHGIRDGAGDVYLFGMTHLSRCYQIEGADPSIVLAAVETALNSLGRPIRLKSAPEEKACLYAPTRIAPVLLSIRQCEDELQVTTYTGQSLLIGQLRCRIALWVLEQRMPKDFIRLAKDLKSRKAPAEKQPKKPQAETIPPKTTRSIAPREKKAAPKRLKKKTPPKRLKK
jgi:hypothetical protein